MQPRKRRAQRPEIQEKVAFLSAGRAYPDRPERVEVVETHMSWVFLTNEFAYKLKKPVRYPFLDFSTLDAREADGRREVSLNERLAPGIYLGAVRLTREADATLALDGQGEVVDWLVRMRRLPADRMLDWLIECGGVSRVDVERISDVLADFYRRTEAADLSPDALIGHFVQEHGENRSVLTMSEFDLPQDRVETVLNAIGNFLEREPEILTGRLNKGLVVDGHGDLRPEHICLLDPPVIFDCLEFNRSLRLLDPVDELAFLGLECERLGADWIGPVVMARYCELLSDDPPGRLVAFYTVFRALVRARLALSHLTEPDPREPEKWVPRACQYLAIAERACVRLRPPEDRRSSPPRGSA